jgi:hypothetical protein
MLLDVDRRRVAAAAKFDHRNKGHKRVGGTQGNRTSEQGEEASEIGVVPPGSLKLAAQRLL